MVTIRSSSFYKDPVLADDDVRTLDGIVVFPEPEHGPTLFGESAVGVPVPVDVPPQFLAPPLLAGRGGRSVLRTRVPETTVDEDHEPGPGEDHVPAPAWHPREWMVHAEPQACSMQFPAQGDLGRGVPASLS